MNFDEIMMYIVGSIYVIGIGVGIFAIANALAKDSGWQDGSYHNENQERLF